MNGPELAPPRYTLYPVTVDVLAFHFRPTEGAAVGGAATVPASGTSTDELLALLDTINAPVYFPAALESNCTSTVTLCELESCRGALPPVTLNPVPLAKIFDTVISVFPVFVNVTLCDAILPALTVPKFTLVGPTAIASFAAATVPDTGTAAFIVAVLVVTETFPVNAPAAFGVNSTVRVLVVPGFNKVDPENPLMLKPEPLVTTPVTVNASSPVFATCTVCELCTPTTAEEKSMLEGVTTSRAAAASPGVPLAIGDATHPTSEGVIAAMLATAKYSRQLRLLRPTLANHKENPDCLTLISGQSQFRPGPSL